MIYSDEEYEDPILTPERGMKDAHHVSFLANDSPSIRGRSPYWESDFTRISPVQKDIFQSQGIDYVDSEESDGEGELFIARR